MLAGGALVAVLAWATWSYFQTQEEAERLRRESDPNLLYEQNFSNSSASIKGLGTPGLKAMLATLTRIPMDVAGWSLSSVVCQPQECVATWTRQYGNYADFDAHLPAGATVIDYGCGSGILAMLAEKLGASPVEGVDIDPQAIVSARDNAERNHCSIAYFEPEDFGSVRPDTLYDVVAANILSGPLKLMAPMLCGRVKPGGALVLSGVLARQADEVIAAYASRIRLSVWAEREGWVALAGRLDN